MAIRSGAARVVICDDAVAYPALVAAWLDRDGDLDLVATTSSEAGLLEALDDHDTDVLLLDFMLPEGPTDAARMARVRAAAPGVRVVLVSSLPEVVLQDEARRLGVDAWCTKAAGASDLRAALSG